MCEVCCAPVEWSGDQGDETMPAYLQPGSEENDGILVHVCVCARACMCVFVCACMCKCVYVYVCLCT